jgi:hypothetical protein
MLFSTALTMATAMLPLVHAVGNAVIFNNCTDPVYVWSVGASVGKGQTLNAGDSFTEPFHYDNKTGGITLKITLHAGGLYDGSPQTNFAYTLDSSNNLWYDISDVYGDPFINNTVAVVPAETSCETISWDDGVPPSGSRTAVCSGDTDVQLILCRDQ